MAQEIGTLEWLIKANIEGLNATLKQAEGLVRGMSDKVSGFFKSTAGQVLTGTAVWDLFKKGASEAFGVIKEGVAGALDDINKMNQTKATLASLGKDWETVGGQVLEFGQKMLALGVDDEAAEAATARFAARLNGDMSRAFKTTKLAADLAASGYGTFQDNVDRLSKVLSGKGARAMIEYGVAVKDGATVTDQLNAIQKRATITAEEFANTTQGQWNRLKLAQDELKNAMGKGILIAFSTLLGKTADSTTALMTNADMMKQVTRVTFQLANGLIAIASTAAIAAQGILAIPKLFQAATGKLDIFAAKAARAIAEAGGNWDKVHEMDAKIAQLQDNTEVKLQSLDQMANGVKGTFDLLTNSLKGAAGEGFDKLNDELDKNNLALTKNTKGISDFTAEDLQLADAASKAADEAKKQQQAFEDMQKKIISVRDAVVQLAEDLSGKLTDAFKTFKEETLKDVGDTSKQLAEIVVTAEKDLKDLQTQLAEKQADDAKEMAKMQRDLAKETDADRRADMQEQINDRQAANAKEIADLNSQIAEKQKILTAQANFQTDLQARIVGKQKQIDDLTKKQIEETDPVKKATLETEIAGRQTALDALKQFGDLDKNITEERRLANLDEFSRLEDETFKRIDLKTEEFISEVTQLRQKQEIANEVEKSITDFYKEQTTIKQAVLDEFANTTIATLQKIGTEARSAFSALQSLQSAQGQAANPGKPGKAMGGFTSGGEMVHAGEWVAPRWIVQSMGGLIGQLENMRKGSSSLTKNLNAPITINAKVDGEVDFRGIAREMRWELGTL